MKRNENDYEQFIHRKASALKPVNIRTPSKLPEVLFDFQRDAVSYALKCGHAALFLDTGLGKTLCQLAWAQEVPGKVLILAPLAVADQTVREAREKLGIDIHHSRDGSVGDHITITNYQKLHLFDTSQFKGVVLDESSILKSFMGKTKNLLCEQFCRTPFRLACTATPAPNDYMELGNHSDFLGIMPSNEMLTRWFINDTMNFGNYRLKGHAIKPFWQWVASWAVCLSNPSESGYANCEAFKLPPLNMELLTVNTDYAKGVEEGMLFRIPSISATTMHREKRMTEEERCDLVAQKVNTSSEAWIVWCETNSESDKLAKLIPDAVEVTGSQDDDTKEELLRQFSQGRARVIVTKPSIAGFGLNWQHCHNVIYSSLSFSYEMFYQSVRRSWRYGQKQPVNVFCVMSDAEMPIWQTLQRKMSAHDMMKSEMRHAVMTRAQSHQIKVPYTPNHKTTLPIWLKAA